MSGEAAIELERRRDRVIAEVGPWTAHNIHLGHGVFTIADRVVGQERRLAPILRAADDVVGGIAGRSVLDLACMEGLFSIELGRHGARVLGIEGRAGHVARADFAREAIGLPDVRFALGDVRDADAAGGEVFDLVLALGILYHLDAPDLFPFVRRLAALTRRAAIVDTHYSRRAKEEWADGESTYHGISVREHDPGDTSRERESAAGSSLDNLTSAWLTKPSLFNLLAASGFTSVSELRMPFSYGNWDRIVLVAIKGDPGLRVLSAPQLDERPATWSEDAQEWTSAQQSRRGRLLRAIPGLLPGPARRAVLARRRRSQRDAPG